MIDFAEIHKYDDNSDFKEYFEKWVIKHNEIINNEQQRLELLGCTNDIIDKIYKSIKYYYCKKTTTRTVQKKSDEYTKREYSKLEFNIIADIKNFIDDLEISNIKASDAYNDFLDKFPRYKNIDKIKKSFKNKFSSLKMKL